MRGYVASNLTDLFTALKHKALKGNPLHLIKGDLIVAPVNVSSNPEDERINTTSTPTYLTTPMINPKTQKRTQPR